MKINIQANANLTQARTQFKALEAQVARLNAEIARTSLTPMGGTAKGFSQAQASARGASAQFANALAASNAFRVEQVRLPSVINKTTEALTKQKLTFAEVFGKKGRANMRAVYKDQLAMHNAFANQVTGNIGNGRTQMTMAVPKETLATWDTLRNRIAFTRTALASASVQAVNWGKQMQWTGRQLMTGLTLPVAAFGVAAGVMAYQVDKEFTRIKKVVDTVADANSTLTSEVKTYNAEIAKLKVDAFETASHAARDYGVAMKDALSVQADLAATGQRGEALQRATTQVVRNATLGEIDYQTATTATIALQQTLKLNTDELADSWAYMNSVENATSLAMKDFAFAIPIALGPMRQMGGDLQTLGTLMTAMVSRGVQVGKAANAIKAMPQRLSRPSKQVQEEFKALTGQDIVELNKNNQDNILGLLTAIENATKNLSTFDRRKALAGLFGSYQLSTMNAMLEGMDDLQMAAAGLEDGLNSQTQTAMNIANQDVKQWRDVSDREIKAFQESASGQFKIALESIKAEVAQFGDPFLEVATRFLDVGKIIFGFFNDLPDAVKKGGLLLLLMGAIIGPAIMLTGLFVQLAGNVGRMLASVLRLAKGMDVLTIAQHATAFEAKLAEKGIVSQQTSAAMLTAQLTALTLATEAQGSAMTAMASRTTAATTAMNNAARRSLPPVNVPDSVGKIVSRSSENNKPLPYTGPSIKEQVAKAYIAPERTRHDSINAQREMVALREAELKVATAINAVQDQYIADQMRSNAIQSGTLQRRIQEARAIAIMDANNLVARSGKNTAETARADVLNAAEIAKKKRKAAFKEFADGEKREVEQRERTLKAKERLERIYQTNVSRWDSTVGRTGSGAPTIAGNAELMRQQAQNRMYAYRAQAAYTGIMPEGASRKELKEIKKVGKEVERIQGLELKRTATAEQRMKSAQIEQRSMAGAAASTAAMAASMGLMMFTSNETANNLGQFLMVAAIAAPAFSAIKEASGGIKTAFSKATEVAMNTASAAMATKQGINGSAAAASTLRVRLLGVRAAMLSIMGPIGWAVTAVGLIGLGVFKWIRSQQKAKAEQIEMNKALADGAGSIADALEVATKKYKALQQVRTEIAGSDPALFEKALAEYSEGDNKKVSDAFKELGNDIERDNRALVMYTDLLNTTDMTAGDAAQTIAALWASTGVSADTATLKAQKMKEELESLSDADRWKRVLEASTSFLPNGSSILEDSDILSQKDFITNAQNNGKVWGAAFLSSVQASDEPVQLLGTLSEQALGPWEELFNKLQSNEFMGSDTAQFLSDNDVENARELSILFRKLTNDGQSISDTLMLSDPNMLLSSASDIELMATNANKFEAEIVQSVASLMGLGEEVTTIWELTESAVVQAKLLTYDEAVSSAKELAAAWRLGNTEVNKSQNILDKFGPSVAALFGISQETIDDQREITDSTALTAINSYNAANGYKEGATALQALSFLIGKVKNETASAADEAKKMAKNMRDTGSMNFSISWDQAQTAVRNAFAKTQDIMADMAREQLDSQAEASADAVEAYWDRRVDQLEAQQERQTDRLEEMQEKAQDRFDDAQEKAQDKFNRQQDAAGRRFSRKQENEQERFDRRWDRRKNAIQKASDARIESINKEIDAEQAADDVRQAIFDAEQKRISRLADAANKGIDFNIALATGDIDQAAKLQNDMSATAANWALEDTRDASDAASKKKIDGLNKTADAIKAETDAEIANLERAEEKSREVFERRQERARRHFDRLQELEGRAFSKSQEMESRRFQKSQEMQRDNLQKTQERARQALDAQAEMARKANDAEWQARKNSLDKQLQLFTAFTVTSDKQLKEWMDKTGLKYKDFGISSGNWFNKTFKEQLRLEGAALGSDSMWAALGADVARQTIKGMGFGGLKGFAHFIKTGQLPDDFGKAKAPSTSYGDDRRQPVPQKNHGGGLIGDGDTGRKGVARTTKGVGPGEKLVLARKKEFMVNERATKDNLPLLKAINSGSVNTSRGNIGSGVGGGVNPGFAGLAAGMVGAAVASGGASALRNAFAAKQASLQETAGNMVGGSYSGTFGSRKYTNLGGVMPWVMEAAQYLGNMFNIKNIGGVGDRPNKSEHPLGRALDFMTDSLSNGQGDALAAEVVKRHKELDAMYVIWRQKINSFDGRGWVNMEDRGSPTANHMDHVHVSFNPTGVLGDLPKMNVGDKVDFGGQLGGIIGSGGKHLPSVPGKGWSTPHDYLNGKDSPIYAFNDGFISKAEAITSGGSPGNNMFPIPYRSYGEVLEVTAHDGNRLLSAHMAPGTARSWNVGDPVKGGTLLGKSSMTGNASGFHTHFEFNGSGNGNARALMSRYGIGLDGGSKAGPVGGAVEDAGVDPGNAWTYGDLPGMSTYDPYTAMNAWIEAQEELRRLAEEARRKADRRAERDARRAEREALIAEVNFQTDQFEAQKKILADLRSRNPKPQGKINTAIWIKDQVKARKEAAERALENWKKANQARLAELDGNVDSSADIAQDVKKKVSSDGSNDTIKTGTYNVLFTTKNEATKGDLGRLMTKADVLGLTEMSGSKRDLLPWIEAQGWGQQGRGDSVLTWNKSKLSRTEGGDRLLNEKTTPQRGGHKRWATWGKFKGVKGGQFIQAVAHTIPPPHDNAANVAVQREQFNNLRNLYSELSAKGVPVILGGDFNDDIRRNEMNFGPGVVSNWKGKTDRGDYTIGRSFFDNMFYNPTKLKLLNQSLMSGSSDHKALLTEFKIPSHADGAQNISWDNTLVNLHKGEGVLTEAQNTKFRNLANNIDTVATGGETNYNSKVEVSTNADANEIARKITQNQQKQERRKATRRMVTV